MLCPCVCNANDSGRKKFWQCKISPPTICTIIYVMPCCSTMSTPICMGLTQHQSLPLLGGSRKRIIIPDVNGIDHLYPVSDATLHQIRAVIEASDVNAAMREGTATVPQQHHVSLGSLPSASSNFSSMSSLGSAASQAYNTPMAMWVLWVHSNPKSVSVGETENSNLFCRDSNLTEGNVLQNRKLWIIIWFLSSTNPILALHDYCNMLMRSGWLHELQHFKQLLDMQLAPQTNSCQSVFRRR